MRLTEAYKRLFSSKGFTYSFKMGNFFQGNGFAVSSESVEIKIHQTNLTILILEDISNIFRRTLSNVVGNMYFGGFIDKGFAIFNITTIESDIHNAIEMGIRNNQDSIYDFNKNEVINLRNLTPKLYAQITKDKIMIDLYKRYGEHK